MQHRVERPPGLEPDEPGHVGAEYRHPRRGQHQQHRHRKGADIEALEDDAKQRHPGLGLAPDRPVGRDRLGLGPRLGIGAQGGGIARLCRPLLAGVVDRVQHHLLAHDLARRARGADQEVVRGRQRREQLGAGQRFRRASGKMRRPKMVPARAISAFHCAPNRPAPTAQVTISRSIGVAPVPTAAWRVANSNMRAGEAPADGVPVAVTSDQMSVDSRRSSAEMWPSSRA